METLTDTTFNFNELRLAFNIILKFILDAISTLYRIFFIPRPVRSIWWCLLDLYIPVPCSSPVHQLFPNICLTAHVRDVTVASYNLDIECTCLSVILVGGPMRQRACINFAIAKYPPVSRFTCCTQSISGISRDVYARNYWPRRYVSYWPDCFRPRQECSCSNCSISCLFRICLAEGFRECFHHLSVTQESSLTGCKKKI